MMIVKRVFKVTIIIIIIIFGFGINIYFLTYQSINKRLLILKHD